jgi:signal transduction histidine kinase/ActR/RegA family two-component response regulator
MDKRKPHSLQTRTLLYNVSIVGAAVACLTGLFVLEQHAAVERELQLRAEALAEFLASQTQFALLIGDRSELERIAASTLKNEDVLYARFSDAQGGLVVQSFRPGAAALRSTGMEVARKVMLPESTVSDMSAGVGRRGELGSVKIGFSTQKQRALFASSVRYATSVAMFSLTLILLVQYFQFRRLLAPLLDLIEFTGKVGKGDLSQTAPVRCLDEIGQLAIAFNQMVRELGVSREEMTVLLKEAQAANRLKSEFLANISHEIRTPMNGIIGMTEIALSSSRDDDQKDCLRLVKVSSDSLLAIINDILDFSKIEAGKLDLDLVDFSIRELLGDTIQSIKIVAKKKELALGFDVADGVPEWMRGDPLRLRQILVNLLGNAIKFTAKGSVQVSLACDPAFAAAGKEVQLHFAVRDTGIGIPIEQQKHIFEPFRQADGSTSRKYGGTGLGLTICSHLAAMMGGRIWVESRPGCGSVFHVTAVLARAEQKAVAPAAEPGNSAETTTGGKLHILLAEDNAINQTLAVRLLQRSGHSVVCANDGRQALEAFGREHFDLVLMDVQMPYMDGFEATSEIRRVEGAVAKHTPILALTANAMKGDRERCLAGGMDGYVAKPIRPQQLFDAIAGLCGAGKPT